LAKRVLVKQRLKCVDERIWGEKNYEIEKRGNIVLDAYNRLSIIDYWKEPATKIQRRKKIGNYSGERETK
jgi:hypothetical protein